MKKVIAVTMAVLLIVSVVPMFALGLNSSNGYVYDDVNNEAVITNYTGTTTSLSIPSTLNGLTVTKVGDYSFADRLDNGGADLTSLTLPSTLKVIGDGAFTTNATITSLTIPANVTSIGQRAFNCWITLGTLNVKGTSLKTIDKWAFRNNHKLATLNLPSSLEKIAEGAFSYCVSLSSVSIPQNVTSIGREAFLGCTSLSSVTINNRDAVIGEDAFALTKSSGASNTLTVYGYKGSTAEAYATKYGFTFSALPEATSITSSVDKTELYVGETAVIKATVLPSTITKAITWTTSNKNVATIAANGTVTAVGIGKATITGTVDNQSCSYTFTVKRYSAINFNLDQYNNLTVTIRIFNLSGKVIKEITVGGGIGRTQKDVTIPGLTAGQYSMEITKSGSIGTTVSNITTTENNDVNITDSIFLRPGDVNSDGVVDINDFSDVLLNSNFSHSTDEEGVNKLADVEGDGNVDVNDLATILLNNPFSQSATDITL